MLQSMESQRVRHGLANEQQTQCACLDFFFFFVQPQCNCSIPLPPFQTRLGLHHQKDRGITLKCKEKQKTTPKSSFLVLGLSGALELASYSLSRGAWDPHLKLRTSLNPEVQAPGDPGRSWLHCLASFPHLHPIISSCAPIYCFVLGRRKE